VQGPMISVIVPSFNARDTIGQALRALEEQRTSIPYEVIVVDSGSDDTAEIVSRECPGVTLVRSSERKYAGGARNLGIGHARGEILAFTDADCIVASDWVEAVAQAHNAPDPVIGGAVGNGNPASYMGWGYYFTEFNQWLPGAAGGPVDDVPGCCWSMKRWAYEKYGPFLEGTYCSDTAFHWRMAEDGFRPRFDPHLRVDHLNPERFRDYSRHEVLHGRCFATVRARTKHFTRGRAFCHGLAAPLLPFMLFGRAAHRVLRKTTYHREFLWSLPVVFWGISAWCWGEFRGYLSHRVRPDLVNCNGADRQR